MKESTGAGSSFNFGAGQTPASSGGSHFPCYGSSSSTSARPPLSGNRGRSHTDPHTALSTSIDTIVDSIGAESHKTRLYELFSLIEREFDALYSENYALRNRLEKQQQTQEVVQKNSRPSLDRGLASIDSAASSMTGTTSLAIDNAQNTSANLSAEQAANYKLYSAKKPPQAVRQKWKGRLVTSLKGSSGGGNILADNSKHRYVQNFKGHSDGVWHVATATTAFCSVVASASADQTARIWSADDGKCLMIYNGHNGSVNSIAIRANQDGPNLTVLTTSGDRSAHIWKANIGMQSMGNPSTGMCSSDAGEYDPAFSDRTNQGVLQDNKANDDVHDVPMGQSVSVHPQIVQQPLIRLTGHTDVVVAGEWLFGGENIITASWDRNANVYDAETGKVINLLSGHDQELTHCSAHPSQKLVATASKGHNDAVTSVVFTPHHHIISGSDENYVKVWDLRNMRSPISAIRLASPANRLSVCDKILAIPQDGRHISIYDLHGIRLSRLPRANGKCHHRMVCCTAWLPENSTNNLISCGFDKQVIGWKVQLQANRA
ncbi:WD repeat-containing protein 37 [Ditylenchus destructor]|uniref:WD repeat-containing protein 37 n=1 Tax=Ditylenchus destructor TaxID=166010 RepID=A0AAD4N696_9BILA|nr:WD repeat-containing protein 37 [Ditylenchus destructor]